MKPQAIIFDLDGVITDTAHLHFMAWKQIADEMGIAIDEVFNDSLKGISRIEDLFDFCADASQITRSKPDPEIFITACKGLGVVPEKCIGIEDAQAGITAINACGMRSVGIGESLTGAGLLLPSTEYLTWSCLSAFWLNA
ncbi:HAD-IA family hydrolase [Salmonella enterica]|nr:HAD-IA family hydrolase [Salmonella enterica]